MTVVRGYFYSESVGFQDGATQRVYRTRELASRLTVRVMP